MSITERQIEILDKIIREYIELAEPISSRFLEKKYNFGIKPASIRKEMQRLTEEGYLTQPHTSAGRIPTDKGYRFFVDELIKKEHNKRIFQEWLDILDIQDTIKSVYIISKKLALLSENLVLTYIKEEDILLKEGWEEVLKKPEFKEEKYIFSFTAFLENFERIIPKLRLDSEMEIYIGKENPFNRIKDFSVIILECELCQESGIISLLGPKRMNYNKNIKLVNSVKDILKNFKK